MLNIKAFQYFYYTPLIRILLSFFRDVVCTPYYHRFLVYLLLKICDTTKVYLYIRVNKQNVPVSWPKFPWKNAPNDPCYAIAQPNNILCIVALSMVVDVKPSFMEQYVKILWASNEIQILRNLHLVFQILCTLHGIFSFI